MKIFKNTICLICIAVLIFAFSGCDKLFSFLEKTEENENSALQISSDLAISSEPTETSKPQEAEDKSNILETDYFKLTIPNSWKNNYYSETHSYTDPDTGEYSYSVGFYEKAEYMRSGCGNLVDVILTTDKEYEAFASGRIVGEMTLEKTYYFFARYPTDVQFSQDTQYMYTAMSADVEALLSSITPKNSNTPFKIY